jgi:hypothetical protein
MFNPSWLKIISLLYNFYNFLIKKVRIFEKYSRFSRFSRERSSTGSNDCFVVVVLGIFSSTKTRNYFLSISGNILFFKEIFFISVKLGMLEATLDRIIDHIEAVIFKTLDFPQNHQYTDAASSSSSSSKVRKKFRKKQWIHWIH